MGKNGYHLIEPCNLFMLGKLGNRVVPKMLQGRSKKDLVNLILLKQNIHGLFYVQRFISVMYFR